MAHKHQEVLVQMSEYMQHGIDGAKELPPELAAVKIRVINDLTRLQGFILGLTGQSKGTVHPEAKVELPPMTHMFGEKLEISHKPVNKEEIRPNNLEKTKFINEVNDWHKNFATIPDEKVFEKLSTKNGEMVIRGVAKKAGFSDFDRVLNDETDMYKYISDVRAAFSGKESKKKSLNKVENDPLEESDAE